MVVGPTALPVPSRPDIVYCSNRPYGRPVITGFGPEVVVVTNYAGDGFYPSNFGDVNSYYPNREFISSSGTHEFGAHRIHSGWDAPPMAGMPSPPQYENGGFGAYEVPPGECHAHAGASGGSIGDHIGDGGGGCYSGEMGPTGCDIGPSGGGDSGGGEGGGGPSDS